MKFVTITFALFAACMSMMYASEREWIQKMAGCFQVDYSYSEIEALDPAYTLENNIHLQHILMIPLKDRRFMMKHHGEDWQPNPAAHYQYLGKNLWSPVAIDSTGWTRSITSLDDGPRYSCHGQWSIDAERKTWECQDSYSPIPGREYRDMKRNDYQGMTRSAKVLVYDWGWLERQDNIKVREDGDDKIQLARETGKIFSIRVDDSHCLEAQKWVDQRKDFWDLSRQVWNDILDHHSDFTSAPSKGGVARYRKIWQLESEYYDKIGDAALRQEAETKLRDIILDYQTPGN